jgi:hypothetical protein
MASRLLNRRELRKHADEADRTKQAEPDSDNGAPEATPVTKKRKTTAATTPKVRKPRAKKAPVRVRARWGIFDGTMKQVAIFDYNQRVKADEKLTDLREKKKSLHFLQIVKEPMPEPVATEAVAE